MPVFRMSGHATPLVSCLLAGVVVATVVAGPENASAAG